MVPRVGDRRREKPRDSGKEKKNRPGKPYGSPKGIAPDKVTVGSSEAAGEGGEGEETPHVMPLSQPNPEEPGPDTHRGSIINIKV